MSGRVVDFKSRDSGSNTGLELTKSFKFEYQNLGGIRSLSFLSIDGAEKLSGKSKFKMASTHT